MKYDQMYQESPRYDDLYDRVKLICDMSGLFEDDGVFRP